jgi:hypothetical protein
VEIKELNKAGIIRADMGTVSWPLWEIPVAGGRRRPHRPAAASYAGTDDFMIRKLKSGGYRLYSRKKNPKTGKRRNLGTFSTRKAAQAHERAVQFFKRK